MNIPLNKAYLTGKELAYIRQALAGGHLSGNGPFSRKCQDWLEKRIGCYKAFLTHSSTAALEMAAILAHIQPGDEVIMPSYTFYSTANAFVLRGGVPVFVDIRFDTLNIDETKIERAITDKTRAIVPVHYAGVVCEMDAIMVIAEKYNLLVIEDASQSIMSCYKGKPSGNIGHMACFSFHETKNLTSGEGGALLINDPRFLKRAEIIREYGTNRSSFFRGEVDMYTWIDLGSSYLPGELIAAYLWAQMEQVDNITERRLEIWEKYHEAFKELELHGKVRRPIIPDCCQHNSHMYYLILPDHNIRTYIVQYFKEKGITVAPHYVPLHNSPEGLKRGRVNGEMALTMELSNRLMRLPLWVEMPLSIIQKVVNLINVQLNTY